VPAGGGAAVALGLDVEEDERDRERVAQFDAGEVRRGGADEEGVAGGERALKAAVCGSVRRHSERMFP
jgi:hypothetical protein